MSLQLLVDEDSQAKYLVNLLQAAGHDVLSVNEAIAFVLAICGYWYDCLQHQLLPKTKH